jgi:hypothetical protein
MRWLAIIRSRSMEQIIEGKRYNTDTATLIAHDRINWEGKTDRRVTGAFMYRGPALERRGKKRYLYRSFKGSFFIHHTSRWPAEKERLEPLTRDQAQDLYGYLPVQLLNWEETFGETFEEA